MTSKNIKPELPGGFRDYLPTETAQRERLLAAIRGVFERYGFVSFETPAVERREILTGGDPAFDKEIFRVGLREGDEDLALRFDLTVPLARVVAAYPQDIVKPFRAYRIGKVWRGERQQAGRYREFLQCDIDIIGSSRPEADAEIVVVLVEVMKALGVDDAFIAISNRKLLNGILKQLDITDTLVPQALRVIDKLDKRSWNEIAEELQSIGLDTAQIEELKKLIDVKNDTVDVVLDALSERVTDAQGQEGISELRTLTKLLRAYQVPDTAWRIDPTIARGLGYYTGSVFEIRIPESEVGSVGGGGRYDTLVERFSTKPIPAVGASIGFDRLFTVLQKKNGIAVEAIGASVLVLNFADAARDVCIAVTQELRGAGIATELYIGQEENLKGQLAYAVKRDIPVVLIIGDKEMQESVVQVKDMRAGTQKTIQQQKVTDVVCGIL